MRNTPLPIDEEEALRIASGMVGGTVTDRPVEAIWDKEPEPAQPPGLGQEYFDLAAEWLQFCLTQKAIAKGAHVTWTKDDCLYLIYKFGAWRRKHDE